MIVHAGPNLVKTLPLTPAPAKSMKKEYSGLECAIEVVRNTEEAIEHIHQFGSSHTDVIVTDNRKNIKSIFPELVREIYAIHNVYFLVLAFAVDKAF